MRIIRGKYGRRRFDVPGNISARPTTDFARENIFNVLENLVDFEGLSALDLFGGTGAISFEFLSRGCEEVTTVEKAPVQVNFIRKVKEMLNAQNLTLVKGDVFRFIDSCEKKFDIIFADPPYALDNIDTIPDLIFEHNLLKPDGILVVEHGKANNFVCHPRYLEHRVYGSVNFSIFR